MLTIPFADFSIQYNESMTSCFKVTGDCKLRIKKAECLQYLEQFEANKTQQTPDKKQSESTTETLASYTVVTDKRGRMSFKKIDTRAILVMIQPAKTHFTIYISKNVVSTPKDALDALADFNVEAVVNPTYSIKSSDPFSVKATLRDATRDELTSVVDALLA